METRKMLIRAEYEVTSMNTHIPMAFTTYLMHFWKNHGSTSRTTSMLLSQDSIHRRSYQQAAASHHRIVESLQKEDALNADNQAALQLHKLTASTLQGMAASVINRDRPELASTILDAACDRLDGEEFNFFPHLLKEYAINQRRVIVNLRASPIARTFKTPLTFTR